MSIGIQNTARHQKAPKSVFFAAVVVVFFCSLSTADSFGFVPCSIDGTCTAIASQPDSVALSSLPQLGVTGSASAGAAASTAAQGVAPVRIKIPSVGIDLPVQNPATRDVDTLDALLNNGPAHYVDSANLGESGNVLIFAHSSHLPIVHNKMFQAFNQIPDVEPGASIELDGADGTAYLYTVDSVVKADTTDGTTIPLSASIGKKLTLVTCDTLTGKSARFILTADFVGVVPAQQ
jgi:LPXTG-site transpeptidase (sortase) family protein